MDWKQIDLLKVKSTQIPYVPQICLLCGLKFFHHAYTFSQSYIIAFHLYFNSKIPLIIKSKNIDKHSYYVWGEKYTNSDSSANWITTKIMHLWSWWQVRFCESRAVRRSMVHRIISKYLTCLSKKRTQI